MTLTLEGDGNDYVGKGLSGGKLVIYHPRQSEFVPEREHFDRKCLPVWRDERRGLYFWRDVAGESGFAVRNSGATAVVEEKGVGDHGCEYMTNGLVVVLGRTWAKFCGGHDGRNRVRTGSIWRFPDGALQPGGS